jgi:hypothetical protein
MRIPHEPARRIGCRGRPSRQARPRRVPSIDMPLVNAADFDLGGKLATWPYGDDPADEQWHLYDRRTGNVLTARADGTWSYHPANTAPDSTPCSPE